MGEDQHSGLASIERAARTAGRGPPPVHLWHPDHCGTIDIRIAANGQWFHEGAAIGREPLVRLFASVLRKDPDGYVLVTPVEKLAIVVEDAPFVAVAVEIAPGRLTFTTNVGDVVEAGPDHAIRVAAGPDGGPRPYLHVRRGLEALIARPVFYELAALAAPHPATGVPAIASGGAWFALEPAP
jgi:hypothetical protein